MLTLVTSWYGTFLLEEDGTVARRTLFPKEAGALAEVMERLGTGEVIPDEEALAASADGGVRVAEKRLAVIAGAKLDAENADVARWMRVLAADGGKEGYDARLLHEATLALGRRRVRAAVSTPDQHIVQVVDTIDELAAQANVVSERLREWYALHYPELVQRVEKHEELAALVSKHGTRSAIRENVPQYADLESPMGADVSEAEAEAFRALARSASTMYATRAQLEKYLDENMPEIAPNVTALVGAVLAARLVRHARGLRHLATMPSGTIQTLGAEKALFRHIKEGKRPPKHGVIFNHPVLHRAPRWQRGNLARALAGKLALAARADAITGDKTLGAKLAADFEKRAEEIRVTYAKRPERGGRPQKGGPRGPPRGKGKGKGGKPGRGGPPGRGRGPRPPQRGGGGGGGRGKGRPPREGGGR